VVVLIRRVFRCVRSWMIIRLVHRSMEDDSKVTNGLYIKRGCLALEDFLFFSLYSFSCIASNSPTLINVLDSCPCPCLSIRISSSVLQHPHHLRPTPSVTVNQFWSYILDNYWAVQRHLAINIILAASICNNATDNMAATSST